MSARQLSLTASHSSEPGSPLNGIAAILIRAADKWPLSWAGSTSGTTLEPKRITYEELLTSSRGVASRLFSMGLGRGTVVGLVTEDPRQFLVSLWGCLLGGYVPCPIGTAHAGTSRREGYLKYLHELLDSPVFIKSASQPRELPDLKYVEFEDIETATACFVESETIDANAPALMMLTSGSTGHPKAVILSHANLLSALSAKLEVRGITSTDIFLNWVPFDHITALAESHFLAVYAGASWIHCDARDVLGDPSLLLQLISHNRVSISLIPNFLLAQIGAALDRQAVSRPQRYDLSSIRHIITGGEANVVATGRRFLELLRSHRLSGRTLWPGFGMTETCAGIVYSKEFPEVDEHREFASVGLPVPGAEIRIVDSCDEPVPAGENGALQVKGDMIFQKYHNSPSDTDRTFTRDGWLRTGDLARIEAERLVLVGRDKDCVIVNGVNYASQELEAAVEQLLGVEPSFSAVFPHRPAGADTEHVVVAFSPTFPFDDETGLARLCREARNTTVLLWGFRPSVLLPLPKTHFPRTSLGKIQRSLMRRRYEAGEYRMHQEHLESVLARQRGDRQAPSSEHERAVTEVFARLFDLPTDSIGVNDSFLDLGGTSLDIIRLIQELTRLYPNSNLSVSHVLQFPTLRSLASSLDPLSRAFEAQYDPIVPLQATGEGVPLFCIHPASGEVLVFVGLAAYFQGDRPFYALRARGFNPGEEYFESFEEMVNEYVAAIRRKQPHGPYAIAGYSFGGPVAFEVAKALEAAGEDVPFVGCIDMPPTVPYPFDLVDIAVGFALFLKLIDKATFLVLPATLRKEGGDPYAAVLAASRPARVRELGLTIENFTSWTKLTFHLVKTILAYEPSGTVDSLTVFRASPLWSSKDEWQAHLGRWTNYARNGVRYIEIEGEHHTLMDGAFLPGFQRTLKNAIAEAIQKRTTHPRSRTLLVGS